MKISCILLGFLFSVGCKERSPDREILTKEKIIGQYIVDSGAKLNFECSFDSDIMIGFRPEVLEHVKDVREGEYGGISITRLSDGWYFAGYDETSALVTPTKSGKSIFQIFNESGDKLNITTYLIPK